MSDGPARPHRSTLSVTLLLGTAATIGVETLTGGQAPFPSLQVEHGDLRVVVEPFGPSEGGRVSACDVLRGQELAAAAEKYSFLLRQQYEAQQAAETPARGERVRPPEGQAGGE